MLLLPVASEGQPGTVAGQQALYDPDESKAPPTDPPRVLVSMFEEVWYGMN